MIAVREFNAVQPIQLPAQYEYLRGCDKCDFGRIFIVPMEDARKMFPHAYTLPELLNIMFAKGLYAHCDCDAGQAAARILETIGAKLAEENARLTADIGLAQQARLNKVFEDARVPRRFADLTLDTFKALAQNDPGKRVALQAIDAYMDHGCVNTPRGKRYGLLLHGRSDMGKTGVLSPLFLHFIRQGRAGLWVQYNDLLAALRDFEGGQVEDRISAAKHAEFLFIDDFGDPSANKTATDYTRDVMFRILDHRNNYQSPTFITSNLDPKKMRDQFDERTVKRLAELCAFVEVAGAPMRDLIDDARTDRRRQEVF